MLLKQRPCTKCGEHRPLDDFYRNHMGHEGRQSACKPCHKAEYPPIPRSHQTRLAYALTRKLRMYNLSEDELYGLSWVQDGRCANDGCREPFADIAAAHVDHDHACCSGVESCGKCVRGLLCGNCNMLKDDLATVLGAAEYLSSAPVRPLIEMAA